MLRPLVVQSRKHWFFWIAVIPGFARIRAPVEHSNRAKPKPSVACEKWHIGCSSCRSFMGGIGLTHNMRITQNRSNISITGPSKMSMKEIYGKKSAKSRYIMLRLPFVCCSSHHSIDSLLPIVSNNIHNGILLIYTIQVSISLKDLVECSKYTM